jgi:hypothetical protein
LSPYFLIYFSRLFFLEAKTNQVKKSGQEKKSEEKSEVSIYLIIFKKTKQHAAITKNQMYQHATVFKKKNCHSGTSTNPT